MDNGEKDKLARAPGKNGRRQDAQKDLQPTTGRDETDRKTQKKMERASRRRSSNAGSEKMERDSDRQKQMEGHCSTGQGSQRAVVLMEEEEVGTATQCMKEKQTPYVFCEARLYLSGQAIFHCNRQCSAGNPIVNHEVPSHDIS